MPELKNCDLDYLLLDEIYKKVEEKIANRYLEKADLDKEQQNRHLEFVLEYIAFLINKLCLEPGKYFTGNLFIQI
jgi:hypothetical protein